ncbi:MAG: Calx-beta domain-containing protein [Planctomycetaceae bacterium]
MKFRNASRSSSGSRRPRCVESLESRVLLTLGTVDTTFGDGGAFVASAAFSDFDGNDSAVQVDGKVVVVGGSNTFGGTIQLVRYNADGSLDPTFGDEGRVISTPQNLAGTAQGVAIQTDGKIVISGSLGESSFSQRFMVARFNTDGTLDTTFGTGGFNNSAFAEIGRARDVAILSDGRIVAGGDTGGDEEFAIARYNADGTLDTSFGTNGGTQTDVAGEFEDDEGHAIAVQPDGRILLGGGADTDNGSFFGGGFKFALLRYNTDGSLDTTFGNAGVVETEFDANPDNFKDDIIRDLVIQPDGKIVGVGLTESLPDDAIGLARYNTDGTLDSTFGTDGLVAEDLGSDEDVKAFGLGLLDGGTLVVAGQLGAENFLAGFESDGSLDSSFGTNSGYTPVAHNQIVGNFPPVFVSINLDDGIFAAGRDFSLARFENDGTLDFSTPGQGELPLVLSRTSIQAPDGKILIGGAASTSLFRFFVTRLNADGSPDNDFGDGSVVTLSENRQAAVESLALRPDGRIVVLADGGTDFLVYQLNADGSFDTAFGTDGLTTVDFGGTDGPKTVAIQRDGKIVVAGEDGSDFALARLNADGSLDTTFGNDGLVTRDFGGRFDEVKSVFALPDGRILAAGQGVLGVDAAVAQFNADGTLDATFGTGGVATADIGGSNFVRTARRLANGKILVVATSNGLGRDFGLAQFNADGSLDTTFGTSGTVRLDFGGTAPDNDDDPATVEVLSDGRIVVLGVSEAAVSGDIFMTVLTATGELDTSFGSNGSQSLDIPGVSGFFGTSSFSADGDIVVSGSTQIGGDQRVAAVRIFGADAVEPGVSVRISDASAVEGASLVFDLTLSAASDEEVTVIYSTADGDGPDGATSQDDYSASTQSVTFAPGETVKTISIPTTDDTNEENSETFFVNVDSVVGAGIADGQGVGQIFDNDSASPVICSDDLESGVSLSHDGVLLIVGTGGNDKLFTTESRKRLRVVHNKTKTDWQPNEVTSFIICGMDGADRIKRRGSRSTRPAVIDGGAGADKLFGGKGNDEIYGGGGRDLIKGKQGDDTLSGGDGPDKMLGQAGNDILNADSGDDQLIGGSGVNILNGGSGDDRIKGGKDADLAIGGEGEDRVEGRGGDDILVAGSTNLTNVDLKSIMLEWTNIERTREQRIANIRGDNAGTGPNGTAYLNAATVFDDSDTDQLKGASGLDWFFASAADTVDRLETEEMDLI